MKTFLILGFFLVFLTQFVYSEDIPPPPDIEEYEEEFREEGLRLLKEHSPEEYEKRKQKNAEIDYILDAFRQKYISESEARSQLHPLLKEDIQNYIRGLEADIKSLKERIDFLKQEKKRNPDTLINERIDRILGIKESPPGDF